MSGVEAESGVSHSLNIPIKNSPMFIRFLILIVLCVYVIFVQFNSENMVAINSERNIFNSSLCGCNKQMFASHLRKPNDTEFYWCSEESFARGYNQKVVTYVLFGNASNSTTFNRYYSLLENISVAVENEYPGFTVRIYHNLDDEGNQGAFDSLCKIFCRFSHVDLCSVNTLHKHLVERSDRCSRAAGKQMPIEPRLVKGLNPKMYRYLVMLDPQVDIFLSRDVDSIIWPREVYAVREWMSSNFTFHLMRDHTAHGSIILAGMWGAKLNKRRDLIQGVTRALILAGQNNHFASDQSTLDNILWPTAKYDVMAHDSYQCENPHILSTSVIRLFPFPRRRNGSYYVGGAGPLLYPAKCPIACRPENHKDWEYC